jgi:hypothetical protein
MAPPRGDRLEGDLGLVTRGPAARAVPRFALLLAPVTAATFSSEASLMMCICSLKRSSVQRSRMTASPADSSHACHLLHLAKHVTSTQCQHVQQTKLHSVHAGLRNVKTVQLTVWALTVAMHHRILSLYCHSYHVIQATCQTIDAVGQQVKIAAVYQPQPYISPD